MRIAEIKKVLGCSADEAWYVLFVEDKERKTDDLIELHLPMTEEDLEVFYEICPDEYSIYKVKEGDELPIRGFKICPEDAINKLNEIVLDIIDDIDRGYYDEDFVEDYIENFYSHLGDFDAKFARDCYKIRRTAFLVNEYQELGEAYAEETAMFDCDDVPEFYARYFDYEAFGRDLVLGGDFVVGNNYFIGAM